MKFDLDVRTIVEVIRMAHEAGMNVSDFISMAFGEYMGAIEEISWTTNLVSPNEDNENGYPVSIPEKAMTKRGWKAGDFVRVTLTEETLTVKNLHID